VTEVLLEREGTRVVQSDCTVEGSEFDSRNGTKNLVLQLQNGLWGPPTISCPVGTVASFPWG